MRVGLSSPPSSWGAAGRPWTPAVLAADEFTRTRQELLAPVLFQSPAAVRLGLLAVWEPREMGTARARGGPMEERPCSDQQPSVSPVSRYLAGAFCTPGEHLWLHLRVPSWKLVPARALVAGARPGSLRGRT